MTELLKELCSIDGTSGDEKSVRDFIISQINGFCEWKTDNLGNIIVFKKGKQRVKEKIMLDAHMDEVGLIITSITDEGFLNFKTVGGINTSALMFKKVLINGKTVGAISGKPVHLLNSEQKKKLPDTESLYIDIGAASKQEAQTCVCLGDRAVVVGNFEASDKKLLSKAIDDRAGCAVLIDLIKNCDEYDFYASFSVQEEIGLRGAKVSTYAINPDFALILEATTAADIAGVSEQNRVCELGNGAAISFMDGATSYDRTLYNIAINSQIKAQPKRAVAGGNNAGAVHLSREGVRTLAISVPCRYLHTESGVCDIDDIMNVRQMAEYMLNKIARGEIK